MPDTLDRELLDEILLVSEAEALDMCRRIARAKGVLVGISSGATAHAALALTGRAENKNKVIVRILADTGQRYLSVKGAV